MDKHYILYNKIYSKKISNAFTIWSKNTIYIYFIHWIILGYSMLLLNIEEYGPITILILSIILFILSDLISTFLSKRKQNKKIR